MGLMFWAVPLLAGYLLLGALVLALGLGVLLGAGKVDWSGERRKKPADPLTVGYHGDPKAAFGWDFETVMVETELGPAEAWLIPAAAPSPLWAIFVHGIGGIRENGYRMVAPLREAGLTVLMITYRNDTGAPPSADRLYSFGLSEWPDVQPAVEWAVAQGAERVVLLGESMGAGVIAQYLARAPDTSPVAGLALDAPMLDFPAVVVAFGRRYHVPFWGVIAALGMALSRRLRTDVMQAVAYDSVAKFEGPVFVAHGRRDPLVPFVISERLAAMRPDTMLFANEANKHPMSFEADRDGYTAALLEWLGAVRRIEAPKAG